MSNGNCLRLLSLPLLPSLTFFHPSHLSSLNSHPLSSTLSSQPPLTDHGSTWVIRLITSSQSFVMPTSYQTILQLTAPPLLDGEDLNGVIG
ncbi:hypothetical protein BDW42DRAFT_132530 [Aspergillus taichungensis]|uniref:Uncharacterized protein n=1 Tax=Aspergillus taichungensis TaxID=482145 RepID=A0A2J5I743_9EURO|nr:hypothetical protein BDW42DRAFT_132530 [Aspergillus taichungensis]